MLFSNVIGYTKCCNLSIMNKLHNLTLAICTPKSDVVVVESEEKIPVFELRRKTKIGKKTYPFFPRENSSRQNGD